MKEKKEIQQKIDKNSEEDVTEEEFYSVLRLISPGTNLRSALDEILHYGKGALIVVENEFLSPLLDGGFKVNSKFTPQRIMELSKMDGGIILSKDLKKILFANVTLAPSTKIKSSETGTRHKAAERTAKQIGGLAISISEKKKEITLFYKNKRHNVKNISEIMRRVNEHLQILEKQRDIFDINLETLNQLEIKNYISLNHAIKTIQRGKIIQKISKEVSKNLVELGKEGEILRTRLKEILFDVKKETDLIIKDYSNIDPKKSIFILDELSYEELLDKERILRALYQDNINKIVNVPGWRILSKTSLNDEEISKLIKKAGGFEKLLSTEISSKFEFLPDDKFALLKVELERLKLGI
jgi:diadenylate cyclase